MEKVLWMVLAGQSKKKMVFGLLKSNKITIKTGKEFATEASNTVGSIQPIRLSQVDEIIELAFVIVFPYIEGTLGTHYVKRCFNANRVCFLEFYRSSNNLEPFHVQYYSQANTLVCDHTGSESNENECDLCKKRYHEDETWLQCPSCKIWFHEECFGKLLFS